MPVAIIGIKLRNSCALCRIDREAIFQATNLISLILNKNISQFFLATMTDLCKWYWLLREENPSGGNAFKKIGFLLAQINILTIINVHK